MIWRLQRPLVDLLTGHWISMAGTALVTLAGFSWLFLLPMHARGHADNPYIGLLAFVALPLMFFTGLALIPIGAVLSSRRLKLGLAVAVDRRAIWRRAAIFFGVMTAANLMIGSQLSYRAVAHMEGVQFCGQTCHVMKPEFTAHLRAPHAAVECVACHVRPGATGFLRAKMAGTRQLVGVIRNSFPRPIESAMESNRLVSSAETCEQCHQREKNEPEATRAYELQRRCSQLARTDSHDGDGRQDPLGASGARSCDSLRSGRPQTADHSLGGISRRIGRNAKLPGRRYET